MELGDEELAAIALRAETATRGPWRSFVERRDAMSGSSFIMTEGEDIYLSGCTTEDQDFIAAARSDVPKLVTEIRRLRAEIE